MDYPAIFERYAIPAVGVLHVGAYVGWEKQTYKAMGFQNVLFVEAQPGTFNRLLKVNLEGTGMHCENIAIGPHEGVTRFHIANNGQSSSILTLKKHLILHPEITEVGALDVRMTTIDTLLSWPKYAGMRFNFLNIDIQGAELLAFTGAVRSLAHIDIINSEINFDELYEGGAHVRQLDAYLSAFGFVRADTVVSKGWGDAIYVRDHLTKV